MSDSFSVTVDLDGSTHTFPCSPDQTVLAAGEAAGVALPHGDRAVAIGE